LLLFQDSWRINSHGSGHGPVVGKEEEEEKTLPALHALSSSTESSKHALETYETGGYARNGRRPYYTTLVV